eukprot:scaffold63499_cov63-Phaeocystis_antarctica.AAC.9
MAEGRPNGTDCTSATAMQSSLPGSSRRRSCSLPKAGHTGRRLAAKGWAAAAKGWAAATTATAPAVTVGGRQGKPKALRRSTHSRLAEGRPNGTDSTSVYLQSSLPGSSRRRRCSLPKAGHTGRRLAAEAVAVEGLLLCKLTTTDFCTRK